MLKKYFSLIISVLCVVAMLLNSQCRSCDDPSNPDCPNYDPCYGVSKTSASFKIEERVGSYWVETDTVDRYSSVRFTAYQEGESYRWLIGADEYHEKSFSLSNFPHDRWIGITLIIKRTPNKLCYPNDNGIDTVYRRFYVWPEWTGIDSTNQYYIIKNPYPIYGSYYGSLKSKPSHQFEVTVEDRDSIVLGARYVRFSMSVMAGIPFPDYDSRKIQALTTGFFGMDAFYDDRAPTAMDIDCPGWGLSGIPETPLVKGLAWLDDRNNRFITIAYRFRYRDNPLWSPMDTFVGQKIR